MMKIFNLTQIHSLPLDNIYILNCILKISIWLNMNRLHGPKWLRVVANLSPFNLHNKVLPLSLFCTSTHLMMMVRKVLFFLPAIKFSLCILPQREANIHYQWEIIDHNVNLGG